jgi:hypothetical protein
VVEPQHAEAADRGFETGDSVEFIDVFGDEVLLYGGDLDDKEQGNEKKNEARKKVGQYFSNPFFNTLQVHLSTHASRYPSH